MQSSKRSARRAQPPTCISMAHSIGSVFPTHHMDRDAPVQLWRVCSLCGLLWTAVCCGLGMNVCLFFAPIGKRVVTEEVTCVCVCAVRHVLARPRRNTWMSPDRTMAIPHSAHRQVPQIFFDKLEKDARGIAAAMELFNAHQQHVAEK